MCQVEVNGDVYGTICAPHALEQVLVYRCGHGCWIISYKDSFPSYAIDPSFLFFVFSQYSLLPVSYPIPLSLSFCSSLPSHHRRTTLSFSFFLQYFYLINSAFHFLLLSLFLPSLSCITFLIVYPQLFLLSPYPIRLRHLPLPTSSFYLSPSHISHLCSSSLRVSWIISKQYNKV